MIISMRVPVIQTGIPNSYELVNIKINHQLPRTSTEKLILVGTYLPNCSEGGHLVSAHLGVCRPILPVKTGHTGLGEDSQGEG